LWLNLPDQTLNTLISGLADRESSFLARRNLLKQTHRHVSASMRRRLYCCSLFLDLQDHYLSILGKFGKGKEAIAALSQDELSALILNIPPLDVEVCLAAQHQQQWDRQEVSNDIRDFSHLCMAVPYCDVVVTEEYWVHKLSREKLDRKYNTTLFSDVCQLPRLLK